MSLSETNAKSETRMTMTAKSTVTAKKTGIESRLDVTIGCATWILEVEVVWQEVRRCPVVVKVSE